MGYYFNPPEKLPDAARPLHGLVFPPSYQELRARLEDGERLFGHYDRPFQGFQNAVWLFSTEEMEEFESQARQGQITRLGYYALSDDMFKDTIGDIRKEQE